MQKFKLICCFVFCVNENFAWSKVCWQVIICFYVKVFVFFCYSCWQGTKHKLVSRKAFCVFRENVISGTFASKLIVYWNIFYNVVSKNFGFVAYCWIFVAILTVFNFKVNVSFARLFAWCNFKRMYFCVWIVRLSYDFSKGRIWIWILNISKFVHKHCFDIQHLLRVYKQIYNFVLNVAWISCKVDYTVFLFKVCARWCGCNCQVFFWKWIDNCIFQSYARNFSVSRACNNFNCFYSLWSICIHNKLIIFNSDLSRGWIVFDCKHKLFFKSMWRVKFD